MMPLVDTDVLLDVLHNEPPLAEWPTAQLRAQAELQALAGNPVTYAATSLLFSTLEALDDAVQTIALKRDKIPRPALWLACLAFIAGQSGIGAFR